MKRVFFSIAVFVAILLLGFVWWRYVPLTDGEYVVGNEKIAWRMRISNGVLRTVCLENRATGERLETDGQDFVMRIGRARTIGWSKEHQRPTDKYPPYMIRDGVTITPEECCAVWLIRGLRSRTFVLEQPDLECDIRLQFTVEKGRPWMRRRLSVKARGEEELAVDRCDHVRWRVAARPSVGGRGQPLFLDDTWFMALEHPLSSNNCVNGQVILRQFPGYRFGRGERALQRMVVGTAPTGAVRLVMHDYVDSIRRPPKSVTLFNTWCHMREDDLTEANIAKTAAALNTNLAPYDAMFDLFVIDDGWQEKKSVWGSRQDRLPGGLSGVRKKIEEQGSAMGLWVSLPGCNLDIDWGVKLGFKRAFTRYYCLSSPEYNRALRKRLKDLIVNEKVEYFKHDFNYFVCGGADHGHFTSPAQSSEANVDALLSVLRYEDSLNPKLFFAVTSGLWPSPWWLPYCDTIWMGGKDHDADRSIPASRGSVFEMNYRDGALYKMLVSEGKVFPLCALMTHGVVDARHTVYDMTSEDDVGWANHVMNYLGRGTMMREFYLSPKQITAKRWEIIARGLRWARSLDDCMAQSHFILGDPRRGELFAYTGAAGDRRYVSIRNPQLASTNVALADLCLTNGLCEVAYPWHEVLTHDKAAQISMPGEGVVQAMTYPKKLVDIPVPVGVRARLLTSTSTQTEYVVHCLPGKRSFTIVSPVPIVSIDGDGLSSDKIDERRWHVIILGARAKPSPTVELLSAGIAECGIFRCRAVVPDEVEAKFRVLVHYGGSAAPVATINGRSGEAASIRGVGWRLATVTCLVGTNDICIGLQGVGKLVRNVAVQAFMSVTTPLEPRRLRIVHRNLTPRSVYDRPFPLLQDRATETSEPIPAEVVTLGPESALLRGKRALTASQLKMITSAYLKVEVFDVNGGDYADKQLFVNDAPIGRLPHNPPPLSEWYPCAVPLPKRAVARLGLDNRVSLRDQTGDAYKIRRLHIEVQLNNGTRVSTLVNPMVYSTSLQWELGEGEVLPRDGTPMATLSF